MKLSRLVAPGLCALLLVALPFLAPAQDKKGSDGDVAKGKEVFEQCGVCHNADSDEKKMGPGLKGLFKKATFSDGKTKVTEEAVRKKIDEGGNGMPAYAEMLDSQEKRSLMAYLKTL